MTIEIVTIPPEQWQTYKDLRLESLRVEPQAFSSLYETTALRPDEHWQGRLREARAGEKSWLLFARQEGQLVGMIGAFRQEASDTAEIVSVYVTPSRRGQGIALALMEAILAALMQAPGLVKAKLGVNKDQAAAVALYKRCGFDVIGEVSGVMGDGMLHQGNVMEKRL